MDNQKKINIKTHMLGLIFLLGLTLNIDAVRVGRTFLIGELANKVSEKLTEHKPWYSRFFKSKPELTVNGIGLVLAFEEHRVDEIVSPSVNTRYSILDLLEHFDQRICIELVKYKNKHNYKNWHNFSEEDFVQLNAIQKKYLDSLSIVLAEKYGEAAKPYVNEINQKRLEFESHNNGYLLERI